MSLSNIIETIKEGLKNNKFLTNEASVSQGIVLPILNALNWEVFNPLIVCPEYSLEGKRVDYALCFNKKPFVFIEVKPIGKSDGAEKQLFEYAFHTGVPLAILTDGKEWNFFLPGEQGSYKERRVYKLDIAERTTAECCERFKRYLDFNKTISTETIAAARDDYKNISKNRQIIETFPKAWEQLISSKNKEFGEIVSNLVENICGYKPSQEQTINFLKQLQYSSEEILINTKNKIIKTQINNQQTRNQSTHIGKQITTNETQENKKMGFSFKGQFFPFKNCRKTFQGVFELFIKINPNFSQKFLENEKIRSKDKRRYLAETEEELRNTKYGNSILLSNGTWLNLHYDNKTLLKIISLACKFADIEYGKDLVVYF
jgi:hypothetical protein